MFLFCVFCIVPELGGTILIPPTTARTRTTERHLKAPESLYELNELELELASTTKYPKHKARQENCMFGKTLNHTAFVGGLKAGNFTNKGVVTSMKTCQDLCCKDLNCDVAVLMKHACFLVACKSVELCKPRKAQLDRFSLLLSYRDRKSEEEGNKIYAKIINFRRNNSRDFG